MANVSDLEAALSSQSLDSNALCAGHVGAVL